MSFPPVYGPRSRALILGTWPSTSPANAACRPETLQNVWGEALREWLL